MESTNKVTIDAETITIPAAQFSRILAAAVHCEYLMRQKHIDEEKICRMRAELTRYQTICENRKRTSGAGASVEPQQTTTDADETKTDAGALAIEAEGRVSGGERAISDIERKHFAKLEDSYIAVCKERDELKAKVNAYEPKILELDAANLDAYEKIACLRKERDELKHQLEMKEEQCKECAALCAAKMQCEELEKERDELKAKLEQMTKFRDECERQFQEKCNELFAANSTNSSQADQLRDALNENEALKEKLKAEQSTNANIGIVYAMKWKDKLDAAERCIEDCEAALLRWRSDGDDAAVRSMFDNALSIIRAYREKKEAAR